VQQVDEQLQRLADNAVAALAFDVADEPDTAGIMLVARIVETLGRGRLVPGRGLRVVHRFLIWHIEPEAKRDLAIGSMRFTHV